jgi:ABC-2 type transport system permease protein
MNAVWIVCKAEVKRRLRSRAYQIGVVVGMLGIAAMIRLPGAVAEHVTASQRTIALAGSPLLTARAKDMFAGAYTIVAVLPDTHAPTAQEMTHLGTGRVIALSTDRDGLAVTVYVKNSQTADRDRIAQLLTPLNVELLEGLNPSATSKLLNVRVVTQGIGDTFRSAASSAVARGVGFGLLLILYLVIILNSQLTLNSVIEEKTNRIAESLVSAIDPLALLYGKIGAGTVLAAVQMIAWLIAAVIAVILGGGSGIEASNASFNGSAISLTGAPDAIRPLVVPAFLFLLLVGLLQFSTIYAAIGSLVSRPEELGSIASALILPIVVAFVTAILALDAPNAAFVVGASFVPLIAPFVMFVRIAVDDPPVWQMLTCAAINVVFLALVAIAAGRLYRVGMLLYGRPPTLRQLWTTIRGSA